jgi:hypothetical protein
MRQSSQLDAQLVETREPNTEHCIQGGKSLQVFKLTCEGVKL